MGFLCCGDHALSDRVAVHDATKNIHKDRLDVWILEDDLESCSDLFFCCAATDIKEVCRVAAVMLDRIHCRHGQAGTVDETGDVAVELDVVEIKLAGLNLQLGLLIEVAHFSDVLVAIEGITFDGNLGIHSGNLLRAVRIFHDAQRIDFNHGGIAFPPGLVDAGDELGPGVDQPAG